MFSAVEWQKTVSGQGQFSIPSIQLFSKGLAQCNGNDLEMFSHESRKRWWYVHLTAISPVL